MTLVQYRELVALCTTDADGKHQHHPDCESGEKLCPIPETLPYIVGEMLTGWQLEIWPQRDIPGWAYQRDNLFPFLWEGKLGAKTQGMRVIASATVEADDKRWMHVSYSRKTRVPSYEDSCLVKSAFIGDERLALALFPRSAEHVNIHPRCLHLWSCLDGDPTPDFRHAGQI